MPETRKQHISGALKKCNFFVPVFTVVKLNLIAKHFNLTFYYIFRNLIKFIKIEQFKKVYFNKNPQSKLIMIGFPFPRKSSSSIGGYVV